MANRCINCEHLGVTCGGPYFFSMSTSEILEWCKARKNYMHLTNAELSDLSGIPRSTITRMFAGDVLDFRYESIRPIIYVLIGKKFPEPCREPEEQNVESQKQIIELLEHENDRLQRSIDTIRNRHVQESDMARTDSNDNIAYLKSRIRDMRALLIVIGSLLFVCVVLFIIAFVVDRIKPDIGFIWRK